MRKFLNDLNVEDSDLPWNWNKKDERKVQWKAERNKYGFDERDTWNLNYTLTLLIYERLKYYREFAPIKMDDHNLSHTYEFEGKDVVLGSAIDKILTSFALYINKNYIATEEDFEEYKKCWELLGLITPSLWW